MNSRYMSVAIAILIVQVMILMVFALNVPMILTSWASSAALIGGLRRSPAARPMAVAGGHIVSGLVGIASALIVRHGLPFDQRWLIAPMVGLAVLAMTATRLLHPPAAANPAITLVLPVDPINFAIALFAGAAMLAVLTFLLDRIDGAQSDQ